MAIDLAMLPFMKVCCSCTDECGTRQACMQAQQPEACYDAARCLKIQPSTNMLYFIFATHLLSSIRPLIAGEASFEWERPNGNKKCTN
eukprot:66669-Pelagomonas_calceolata.AAC.4